jgi:hypothetical protein
MRVTSSLWVGAFIRRCYGAGAVAMVARRGSDEAGAIFIIVDKLNGVADLYGPAPQSSFEDARPSDRLFQKLITAENPEAISTRVESERKFDPDLWVVAVEDRDGKVSIETVEG